jgi:hypothetical protein
MDPNKRLIIDNFRQNVKGRSADVTGINQRHDGRYGHWLEQQFGILANGTNVADYLGYEIKNETTSSKTTFGDWSANRYIFKNGLFVRSFNGSTQRERQDDFCRIFGKRNELREGRYSWSGTPVPKIYGYNTFGQILVIEDNLDITARYSFSQDLRPDKHSIVPVNMQREDLVIAQWFGIMSPSTNRADKCLKYKLEDKFNDRGWFTCKTDLNGIYQTICFGEPMNYDNWIELVREGKVFLDSGMYQGNHRPYSQWRATNGFWESLIVEEYV